MDSGEYKKNFESETEHWWYKGRRELVSGLVKKYAQGRKDQKILDAGCGTGIIMKDLSLSGEVFGADASPEAINFCRERGIENLVQADLAKLPFSDGTFDMVTMLDVLYHEWVRDQSVVLNELKRVLKNGGILISMEPAFNFLMTKHSKRVQTARRYTKRQMKELMERSGFKVIRSTYWNMFMFPAYFMIALIEKVLPVDISSSGNDPRGLLHQMSSKIYGLDSFLFGKSGRLIGTSVVTVCIKEKERYGQ